MTKENYYELYEKFVNLLYRRTKLKIEYSIDQDTDRPHLYIDKPWILAYFAGYLKKTLWKEAKSQIFFRGQTKDCGTMIPSLFRDIKTFKKLQKRYDAYNELITKLPDRIKARRFQRESAGAKCIWIWCRKNTFKK